LNDLSASAVSQGQVTAEEINQVVAVLDKMLEEPAGPDVARQALTRIVKAYPPTEVIDPKSFIDDAIEALEDFPSIFVEAMADPKVGIVRTSKFAPRIAELVAFCESQAMQITFPKWHALDALRQIERAAETARRELERAQRAAEWERNAPPPMTDAEQREMAERAARVTKAAAEQARMAAKETNKKAARVRWEQNMWRALNGNDADEIASFLGDAEALCEEATDRELKEAGSGWPFLAGKIAEHREAAEKVRPSIDRAPAATEHLQAAE
jgi:hypothetical protein